MRLTDWFMCGYADHRDRTPTARAPRVPEEELYLVREQARENVVAYWDGWDSGVQDAVSGILRRVAREQASVAGPA